MACHGCRGCQQRPCSSGVKVRDNGLPCWCAMYRTMTESIPGHWTSGSVSPESDDEPSSEVEFASVFGEWSTSSLSGWLVWLARLAWLVWLVIALLDVRVLAMGMVKWRNQKATSLVNFDASLHQSCDLLASSNWARLAALKMADVEHLVGGTSSKPLLSGVAPLDAPGSLFWPGGSLWPSHVWARFDAGSSSAVPATDVLSSPGSAGCTVSLRKRLRPVLCPPCLRRRSATTKFQEFSTSARGREEKENKRPYVASIYPYLT